MGLAAFLSRKISSGRKAEQLTGSIYDFQDDFAGGRRNRFFKV